MLESFSGSSPQNTPEEPKIWICVPKPLWFLEGDLLKASPNTPDLHTNTERDQLLLCLPIHSARFIQESGWVEGVWVAPHSLVSEGRNQNKKWTNEFSDNFALEMGSKYNPPGDQEHRTQL